MSETLTAGVLSEVAKERLRQDAKWGRQDHTPMQWLAVLASELGEIGQALVEVELRGRERWRPFIRSGLVQLAAVAVAAVESLDRSADSD